MVKLLISLFASRVQKSPPTCHKIIQQVKDEVQSAHSGKLSCDTLSQILRPFRHKRRSCMSIDVYFEPSCCSTKLDANSIMWWLITWILTGGLSDWEEGQLRDTAFVTQPSLFESLLPLFHFADWFAFKPFAGPHRFLNRHYVEYTCFYNKSLPS